MSVTARSPNFVGVALAAFTLGLFALAGCGIANSFGVPHALHSEEASFCHYCASQESVCDSFENGGACTDPDSFAECGPADAFGGRDENGPFVSPYAEAMFVVSQIDRCPTGTDEVDIEVAVVDLEADAAFRSSYDGEPNPFDLSKDVEAVFDGGETPPLLEWTSAENVSNEGEIVYRVRLAFCLEDTDVESAAIQLKDERGHTSNVVCVSQEQGASDAE